MRTADHVQGAGAFGAAGRRGSGTVDPSLSIDGILEVAVEASPTGIIVCDEEGNILLVNSRIGAIFGYRKDELLDGNIDQLVPEQSWRAAVEAPGRELSGLRKDRSEVRIEFGVTTAVHDGHRLMVASVVDLPDRRRLQRLEGAIAKRLAFEREIAEVAACFIDLQAEKVDGTITESLHRIVEALDVDRSSLWQYTEDGRDLQCTHVWTRPGFPGPPPNASAKEMFPWFLANVSANKAVWHSSLSEVSASPDCENLVKVGVRANAVIPMTQGRRVVGALAFACLRREVDWSPNIRERISLLADVFAQALARQKSQEQLARSLSDIERLRDRLAIENVQLRDEVKTLRGPQMIADESQVVRDVLAQVESVARTSATVLLLGETGSGKELFAQAIHAASDRCERPMVRVNCAAIPIALMESELFGRERGAYTGALSQQIGRFELANGSTIFLDEIGELALEAQTKFLRVIQDKVLERLGSVRPIKVDVRIIAATNRDLGRAVAAGSFREDLYYRLDVFPITIPPLRERAEDIPVLVWTFVEEFSRTFNKKIESIRKEDLAALQRYSWPGNVRELRNVIERAVIVAKGPRLSVEPPRPVTAESREGVAMTDVEAQHIRGVLERVGWRVRGPRGAAELLEMKPTTLESRMAKLGIRRPRA